MSENIYLYRAHRECEETDNNWYEGDLVHSDGNVYIHPIDKYASMVVWHGRNFVLKEIVYKADKSTLCKCTGKCDIAGQMVFENDVIENEDGFKMVIRYGTYEAYCPHDDAYMENVGFYAEAAGLPSMPIGNLCEYARIVGNLIDTPGILEADNKRIPRDTIVVAEDNEICPGCGEILGEQSLSQKECEHCGQLLNI